MISRGIKCSILKAVMGIRVDEDGEMLGLDKEELGIEAYPEFSRT
jgi:Amt family ammonium transporter